MNGFTDKHLSILSGEALLIYRRVKLSSGVLVYADAGENAIGITLKGVADATICPIKLLNDSGSFLMTAAGAFAVDAEVYGTADGKVDDVLSGNKVGVAVEAASADLDVVEIVLQNDFQMDLQSNIVDPAAMASVTATDPAVTATGPAVTATGPADHAAITFGHVWNGSTYASAEEGAELVADLGASLTAAAANNTSIDALIIDVAANNTAIDALIVDVAAAKTAIDANNAAIDSILLALEAVEILATS